jgi:hypothetical protein
MPKVWNIGNTTVRNPKRIENALKVFLLEGFSGNAKGSDEEKRLHEKLKEHQVLEFDGEPSDWNGRKWRAAFYQLGFISYEKYTIGETKLTVKELFEKFGQANIYKPFQLTKSGQKLIDASTVSEIDEIYTRQFLCYELPNSLEGSFPNGKLKPFVLFLEVLFQLQTQGNAGLNKFETGLFIQLFQDHVPGLSNSIVKKILQLRTEFTAAKDSKAVKLIRDKYLKQLGNDCEINPLSVVGDYADTTFRYFSLSGMFTRVGDTIVIRPNKMATAAKILEKEPEFLFNSKPVSYFEYFYNNTYPLPVDDVTFAIEEIRHLKEEVRDKANPLITEAENVGSQTDVVMLQSIRQQLTEYTKWEKEEDYAKEQQTTDSVKDILRYLKTLNGESISNKPDIDDKPAYLEWAVWRSFLAIDEIVCEINKTRRFPIDQDFLPRNTAPGGGSDLIFEFENYVLVVEVTLTVSNRQMAVESEPVRRHTVQYKEQYPSKDIYCLFIAPEVDNNVAETFRIGVWYKKDVEEFVNIVPMSLGAFNKTIEHLVTKKYRNRDFQNLLIRCLASRNVRAPQWQKSIDKEVDDWIRNL